MAPALTLEIKWGINLQAFLGLMVWWVCIAQNAFTSTSGARRLRGSFSIIRLKVSSSRLFPFLKSLSKLFKKSLFLEDPIFGDEGIQRILDYSLLGWFTSSYASVWCYRGNVENPMWAYVVTIKSSRHNYIS